MTGLQSFLGGFGSASRTAASAAESPSPGANASHDLYTLRESDTPTSAESPPDSDVRHHRPRTHARTLGDLRPMTPGEAVAYARAVCERVEERPFESQPLLPRTPANNAAAASELGAEGDGQPAELVEAEGTEEAEIAEGAEQVTRVPRWGGKSVPAWVAARPARAVQTQRVQTCRRPPQDTTHALSCTPTPARTTTSKGVFGSHARSLLHTHPGRTTTSKGVFGSHARSAAHPHGR